MTENPNLFTPFKLGDLQLKNRIVMSPMTRGRTPGGVPNSLNVEYYAERAAAGLIVAESTDISPGAAGFVDNPKIYDEEHVDGWKRVTDAVHSRGGTIFLQLWHCGHNSHPLMQPGGGRPFGPSAIPAKGSVITPRGRLPVGTPRALEITEVPALLEEYRHAAVCAKKAGFDGVEVHAGNGYLLDQFLRDSTNKRTDQYGGPPENRRRLLMEVVEAVFDVWDRSRVGVRLSPTNPSNYEIFDSNPTELYASVADGLRELNVGYLNVVEGTTSATQDPALFDYIALRKRFGGVYIANNRYTFERGNEAVGSGRADLVSFGRPFIANPDLVERFRRGAPLNEFDLSTKFAKGRVGYVDYPKLDQLGS